jgi:hypothetical protein
MFILLQTTKNQLINSINMKRKKRISSFLFASILVVAFSSCAPEENHKKIAYGSGEILVENIIEYYFIASEEINFVNNYQLELASILSELPTDSIEYKPLVLVDDLTTRIKVFTDYLALLQELNKENNIGVQSVENKMFNLLNTLDSSSLGDETKIQEIRAYISANQFNAELAVAEMSSLIYKIWEADVVEWRNRLTEAYNNYVLVVDNIPYDVFDEKKLENFVYEPYKGKETLVRVYKLNMKQEANKQRTIFIDRTVFLMNTFMRLTNLYNDMSARNPDYSKISWHNQQIFNQLKTFENNKLNYLK